MATRKILFRGQTRHKGEKTSISGKPLPGIWVTGGIFPQNKGYERAIIYTQDPKVEKHVVYAETVGQYTGVDDVTRSKIIEDLKFFQKAWRGYEEKPVKDAQKILDGISALFGEEVASK